MKILNFYHRGTQIVKIQFSEIESYLEEKGIDVNNAFSILADENENIYVSYGFYLGLLNNVNSENEWHHYFKKNGNEFIAGKFQFN